MGISSGMCVNMNSTHEVYCDESIANMANAQPCIYNEQAGSLPCQLVWPARFVSDSGFIFHDKHESTAPIEKLRVDFASHRVIPPGFKLCDEEPPGIFSFVGRDARMICNEYNVRSVLMALPNWAVDFRRASSLQRMFKGGDRTGFFGIEFIHNIKSANTAIFGFIQPEGEPLHIWTSRLGMMQEMQARLLCRDLLLFVRELQSTPIRFWGLVLPSMVFLTESGRLASFVPLGSLLSYHGVQATIYDIDSSRLAPEVTQTLNDGDRSLDFDRVGALMADVYAVAAVILEAMCGASPAKMRTAHVTNSLSETAVDFLHRVLHKDPAWRLSVEDSLQHPWLQALDKPKVQKRRSCQFH